MKENLRHNIENEAAQLDKLEFGDGETERNARRALNRHVGRKGIKQKFLGNKKIFKTNKNE